MTSKKYFEKICKNLNSYEFTDEFKIGKKQIKQDLEKLEKLKKAVEIVKKKKYAIKKYFPENNTWATMGLCLSTDFIREDKNNDSKNIPPIDNLLIEEEASIIGEVFGVKLRALNKEEIC